MKELQELLDAIKYRLALLNKELGELRAKEEELNFWRIDIETRIYKQSEVNP